jgi:serine/threonine-protein kinase
MDQPLAPAITSEARAFVPPTPGESITSFLTQNTYIMGEKIGEGSFGEVYSCMDVWNNELAAKVLKPLKPHDQLSTSANEEFQKLLTLRHPNITYIFDAFEYRDTFYIITERCHFTLANVL